MNLLPTPTSLNSSGRAVFEEHTKSPTLNIKSSNAHLEPTAEVEEIFTTPDATMKLTSSQKDTEEEFEEEFEAISNSNELDHGVELTLGKLQKLEDSNIPNESLLELKSMILRTNLRNTILKNELNRERLIFKHEKQMLLNRLENCQETIISNGILNDAITNRNIKLSKYIKILKNEKVKRYVNENRQLKAKLDHLRQQSIHINDESYNYHSTITTTTDNNNNNNLQSPSPISPLSSKLNTLGRIASVYLGENDNDSNGE